MDNAIIWICQNMSNETNIIIYAKYCKTNKKQQQQQKSSNPYN